MRWFCVVLFFISWLWLTLPAAASVATVRWGRPEPAAAVILPAWVVLLDGGDAADAEHGAADAEDEDANEEA